MTPHNPTNHHGPRGRREARPTGAEFDERPRSMAREGENGSPRAEQDASQEAEEATRQALMDTYNG